MKRIVNISVILILVAAALYFYKITLSIIAIIVLLAIWDLVNQQIRDNQLKKFRTKNIGNYFFWYSSNKRIKDIIEQQLIPLIDVEYCLIYTNREKIQSDLTTDEISYLRKKSDGVKFPLMIKIGADRLYAESFFEEVMEYKQQTISKNELEKKIIRKLNSIKHEQIKHNRRRP
ncbi:MAG: hypothetical protein IPP64_11975 [Bacteroidetes bacterium]|nr:hypothetical protein [Bacteroidota bacterium]